jgi:nascent polypeptide-associated complex subunit alpha
MGKLPKAMLEAKKAKMSRAKGSAPGGGAGGGGSRAMRRQMQKQGIDGMVPIDAKRVIIQCADKQIVIDNPQVVALKQSGMTIHQVIGEPTEHDLSEILADVPELAEGGQVIDGEIEEEEELTEEDISSGVQINQQDVMLVSAQAGVSPEVAKAALEEADGDLARAILNLKTRK